MKGSIEKRMDMEAYKTLPEGTRVEMIDNVVYEPPTPVFNHQDLLLEIAIQLRLKLKNHAKVIVAPFDVYLDEVSNAVQPDIVVILNSNDGTLNRTGHFHGVPDVVVEILSPGNRNYDLVKKKALYQKFGVGEYWIIDPNKRSAMVFILENDQYRLDRNDIGRIRSKLLNDSFSF
jgi:Uma2 family endonuclease